MMSDRPEPILTLAMRKLEQRTRLSSEDRAAFLALPASVKRLETRSYIVREADIAQSCCVLLTGFAYRHKTVGNGARQILSIHIPGDMVDLHTSFLGIADHSVQMLTFGEVALIPAEAVRDIAYSHPTIGRAMLLDTLADGAMFREWIANVGRRGARARVAHLLCEFAVRLQAAANSEVLNYVLPMSQEQIADATGLTSVHVNRMLQSLRHEGVISTNKRSVAIEDWEGLVRAGDFNAAYLHTESFEDEPR
jgi:CRP-like cAMP-binding protein